MLIGEFESQATPSPRSSRAARCGCPGSTGCTTSSSTCWTLIGEFESVIETRWMLIGEFESQATPSPRSSRAARCGCPGSTGCTTSSSTCWTLIESGNTVASFLTRGTLWLSWEHGLHHFLKYLLDADWSVCAGNWIGSYLPTHGSPDLLGPPISLSPALRFGCLSVRRFYWSLQEVFRRVHRGRLPAAHFISGQLIWREYFYTMSVNNPQYGQMEANPICLDIPWRQPRGDELERWKSGRTGFPFIDAAMRQLLTEGWLHHAVRNTVASFLTRGTLWLSWEHGLHHFLKYLLDADW
ncbi:unnamed protein product [Plutella xylostella]|uniref:Cryptochrome-1 n=1 Tax=Plutella xylostella TaxID=51655 RepID=A0A8S4FZ50_PLUXY|nr:unnamed protein product [Plutella xylostella]